MTAAAGTTMAPGAAQPGRSDRLATATTAARGWLAERWLTLAVGLCAAGPVLASTLRALIHGWLPAGDQAIIATRAYDVLTTRTPLVGQHSDAGALIHQVVYSPGPMLYWLLALPVRLASPWALIVTIALLNTASIVAAVALARRRGGRALMLAAAIAIVVMSRSLAPEVLHDVWNPSAALFPFTLLIFLCWSLACGEYRLLPATVLMASFVVQGQLTFLLPSLALLAIGLVGLFVSRRSQAALGRHRTAAPPGAGREGSLRRWALAAVIVAVVCWAPPVIDQVKGSPGNMTEIVRTATSGHATVGPAVGWHAVVLAVGIRPWWTTDPSSAWQRKTEVRAAPDALATVSTVLLLCALVALAAIGIARRRVEVWAGALICLALCGALGAVAAATPDTHLTAATLGYTLWWGSPAGMFVWLFLAFAPVALVARRPLLQRFAPAIVAGVGIAAVATCAIAVAAKQRADEHLQEYRPLGVMTAALDRRVPAGRTVLLLGALDNQTFRFKMAARFALVRRGIHPLSPGTDERLGSWYELDHRRYDCTVYVKDGRAIPAASAERLAGFTFAGAYPMSVWVSPAGCPRNGAAALPASASAPPEAKTVARPAGASTGGGPVGPPAATSVRHELGYTALWVSYAELLRQVRSAPLIRAIINPARSDVEIKFRNLLEWHAAYPAGAQATLQRRLHARGVRIVFVPRARAAAARPAAVHHHLRYIAGGVIVALAAIGAGVWLYRRGRRGGAEPS